MEEKKAWAEDRARLTEFSKDHLALFHTDSRLINARRFLPFEWRDDWTKEQEDRLIGWKPGMEKGLKTGWLYAKSSFRGLRPTGPSEARPTTAAAAAPRS